MKLLLDENLPIRLKHRFSPHLSVSTVHDQGWQSVKNGELLQRMNDHAFTILVTADQHLRHQQNLEKHQIVVILLNSPTNRYESLRVSIPLIEAKLPPKINYGVIEITL